MPVRLNEDSDDIFNYISNGDIERVQAQKAMLQKSPPIDSMGCTVVHYAARIGNLDMLQFFVDDCGINCNDLNNFGIHAMFDAVVGNRLEVLKWFIEEKACNTDVTDEDNATLLHIAARFNHSEICEYLLKKNSELASCVNKFNAYPLHYAVLKSKQSIVQMLIEENPRAVNAKCNDGTSAVYLAAQEGNLDILKLIVKFYGGDIFSRSRDGMLPVHAAAQFGHLSTVVWLCCHSRSLLMVRDYDGATPLHFAASRSHIKLIKWFILHSSIDVYDNLGSSPLHDAAENGQLEACRILIEYGCDVHLKDIDGMDACDLAHHCGHFRVEKFLREKQQQWKPRKIPRKIEMSEYPLEPHDPEKISKTDLEDNKLAEKEALNAQTNTTNTAGDDKDQTTESVPASNSQESAPKKTTAPTPFADPKTSTDIEKASFGGIFCGVDASMEPEWLKHKRAADSPAGENVNQSTKSTEKEPAKPVDSKETSAETPKDDAGDKSPPMEKESIEPDTSKKEAEDKSNVTKSSGGTTRSLVKSRQSQLDQTSDTASMGSLKKSSTSANIKKDLEATSDMKRSKSSETISSEDALAEALEKVPAVDEKGNPIPQWKRNIMAKKLANKDKTASIKL